MLRSHFFTNQEYLAKLLENGLLKKWSINTWEIFLVLMSWKRTDCEYWIKANDNKKEWTKRSEWKCIKYVTYEIETFIITAYNIEHWRLLRKCTLNAIRKSCSIYTRPAYRLVFFVSFEWKLKPVASDGKMIMRFMHVHLK